MKILLSVRSTRYSFSGSAPRLSERRTFIFGLTSMSFVSTLASRFLRYFWQRSDICAILFQSDILEQIVFVPSSFEQPSRQGIFLLIFLSFSRNDVSGEQCRKKQKKSGRKNLGIAIRYFVFPLYRRQEDRRPIGCQAAEAAPEEPAPAPALVPELDGFEALDKAPESDADGESLDGAPVVETSGPAAPPAEPSKPSNGPSAFCSIWRRFHKLSQSILCEVR